jgi:hypothetical protein
MAEIPMENYCMEGREVGRIKLRYILGKGVLSAGAGLIASRSYPVADFGSSEPLCSQPGCALIVVGGSVILSSL